jgi:hypothetical protein
LFALETTGHILWLRGYIPDNRIGGEILYGMIPLACFIVAVFLAGRRFL